MNSFMLCSGTGPKQLRYGQLCTSFEGVCCCGQLRGMVVNDLSLLRNRKSEDRCRKQCSTRKTVGDMATSCLQEKEHTSSGSLPEDHRTRRCALSRYTIKTARLSITSSSLKGNGGVCAKQAPSGWALLLGFGSKHMNQSSDSVEPEWEMQGNELSIAPACGAGQVGLYISLAVEII